MLMLKLLNRKAIVINNATCFLTNPFGVPFETVKDLISLMFVFGKRFT